MFTRPLRLIRLHWRRLLSELLVVFVGVYGAFMLNNYREKQHVQQQRVNYLESFKEELVNVEKLTDNLAIVSDTLLTRYKRAIANGERPMLNVHLDLVYPINMLIIRSAFNEQHFEAIGSEYVAKISNGSNIISLLQERVEMFHDKSRDLLIYTGGDPDVLYDKNGTLKPAYQWYLQDLAYFKVVSRQLQQVIEKEAIPDIERLIQQKEE
ncbi:hypothetical protein D770_13555 [Flammeovirgaceae bacterium 311]|nr:hypothetical protein D770_13555 [Flammeovirgaceae bacterium 311]